MKKSNKSGMKMRKMEITTLLLVSLLSVSFLPILTVTATELYVSISPDEANALITSNEDMVTLDIRPADAYNTEHIKDVLCEEELEDIEKIHNLEGGLKAWKEAGFQTVETRTLTPPLPSFPTSSPASAPSQASTPVTTSTPVATTPASSPTQTSTTSVPSSSSKTPGFEVMSMVIGIAICTVIVKKRKQNIARR